MQSSVSVMCPTLIGRAHDLLILQQNIDRVPSGHGQVVLISGEAGIGKSRLVTEAQDYATLHGFVVFHGNSFQPDISCPYAPLLDLFRSHFTSPIADPTTELIPFAHAFSQLLPDILSAPADLIPQLEPEQEKRRLFSTLVQFFVSQATRQPVLVVIEDLHWSDDTSIEFLQYLARRCTAQPLLLVITYRSDEIRPVLGHFLAQLDRERIAEELSLRHLTRADVENMLRAIFDLRGVVRTDFLDAVYALTEGNPFFVEEILKSLVAAGEIFYSDGSWDRKAISDLHIPRSVQDAVQLRFNQLGSAARKIVILAAVAGRRFDFDLLQALSEHGEEQLLAAIKELISAQLVVEESADQFAFRHALTRQAIYTGLLARERKALHQTIGETLEQIYLDALEPHLADLAYHFFESGQWEKALNYSTKAGARAWALFAPYAAIEHLTHALDAALYTPGVSLVGLYRDRGQAYELIGDFEAARSDYEKSLIRAQAAGDGLAEWGSLINLGALWAGHDYEQTGAFFRRALEVAQTLNDPKLRPHSLNRLGNWLVNVGQAVDGLEAHHEALALFQALGDKHGMAETLDLLAMASGMYGDAVGAINYYRDAVALFRELDNPKGLISSLASRCSFSSPVQAETSLSPLRKFEDAELDTEQAQALARKIGSLADESYVEWTASTVCAGFGEFGRALRHAQRGLALATEIEHPQWTAGAHWSLGHVYTAMLASELAVETLEAGLPFAQAVGSAFWSGNITAYLALAHIQQGNAEQAEAVLKGTTQPGKMPQNAQERRVLWAWGELVLEQGNGQAAFDIATQLIASVPGGPSTQSIPILLHLGGRALMMLGRMDEARTALEDAVQGALERDARPLLWQIHVSLGRLHQELKNEAQARTEFSVARTIIESLAETIDDALLREGFLNAAQNMLPKEKPLSARRAEAEKFGGLTLRERQVAVHIAQGKSNHEIGDILFLSERTVETHVRNVLSKLGFTSRAQIAAWVVEKDLAKSDLD